MRESYFTIYKSGVGETTEKKSRFLGLAQHVTSEEEALAAVEAVRREHYDARHHCFAWVIGEQGDIRRAADDGEPQGTAGMPMLEVLEGRTLRDVIVIVTRYFGGTLLGTGGLVRNYTAAAQAALEDSVIIQRIPGTRAALRADYTDVGKLQHLFGELQIPVVEAVYEDKVTFDLVLPQDVRGRFDAALAEVTAGRAQMSLREELYYSEAEDKTIIL